MIRRILLHAAVIIYLFITFQAFTFTFFRTRPVFASSLVQFAFGMMAPYQTYLTNNEELRGEVTTASGEQKEIALEEFLPFIRGERAVRAYLVTFRYQGTEVTARAYERLTQKIFALLTEDDPTLQSLRLCVHRWPRSPGGFSFLHVPAFTERECFAKVP